MPELHVLVRWPDDAVTAYYSPSLVIREYLEVGRSYLLADFVERSRTALTIGSERVRRKYGIPCSRAAQTLAQIEGKARDLGHPPHATVRIESYAT